MQRGNLRKSQVTYTFKRNRVSNKQADLATAPKAIMMARNIPMSNQSSTKNEGNLNNTEKKIRAAAHRLEIPITGSGCPLVIPGEESCENSNSFAPTPPQQSHALDSTLVPSEIHFPSDQPGSRSNASSSNLSINDYSFNDQALLDDISALDATDEYQQDYPSNSSFSESIPALAIRPAPENH